MQNSSKPIIFSKNNCQNCEIVKSGLKDKNIDVEVYNVQNILEVGKFLNYAKELEEIVSFPIFVEKKEEGLEILEYKDIMRKFDIEPILLKNINRFTLYPIKYHDIFEMYLKGRQSYWQPEEIDFSKDFSDFESLSDDEKHFISHVLSFFSASDGIVNENIGDNFINETEIPEIRAFYTFQSAIETVHSETYGLLLDTYIKDPQEKLKLLYGIHNFPAIKEKADWAIKWTKSGESNFATRLVAFACVEGIFFSGSFCAIFWLKQRGLMPGLTFSNELISRDEGLHTDFAVLLYKYIVNKIPQESVHAIFKDAVKCETKFITESLPCKLLGMNDELMKQYIQFVADRLLKSLGYETIWNVSCPFGFMENISLSGKSNFFERRVGEYAKSHSNLNNMDEGNDFDFTDDF